ncbi:hypothetical protein [Streptomyces sp. NPDC006640]|uniref:hypothetical protein n=1 Tax=unclassified Streptomyces TaxID=2593676 RepID=UPI00368CB02B
MSARDDVSSELPDGEALTAFARSALGGGRRRGGAAARAAAVAAPPAADAPESVDAAQPAPASGGGAPAIPHPSPEGENALQTEAKPKHAATPKRTAEEPKQPAATPAAPPEPAPEPEQEPAAQRPQEDERGPKGAEVEVRAVVVPTTRTAIPRGLQAGGVIEVQVPDLGPTGSRATQCTVMLSQNVRDRFARYQLEKKMAGEKEPSNALVVRRAFLYARRNDQLGQILASVYHQAIEVDEEDYDEDGMLGDVIGRRTVRGRLRDNGQQSFRPSEQELATYDAYSRAYGFPNRSDFMEGILDHFLPQLPGPGRRR